MKNKIIISFFVSFFAILNCFSQDDIKIKADSIFVKSRQYNPLSPSRAAFYSAVLPGLGQAYNKKYWKIPIVYGAIGTSLYYYKWNNDKYKEFFTAYKNRLNGQPDIYDGSGDKPELTEEVLISAQKFYKKNRELSLFMAIGFYVLQIVEASVNAHLLQHNVNDNLSFRPEMIKDNVTNNSVIGASINFSF